MTKNDRFIGIILLGAAIYMFYYANVAEYNQFGGDPGPALMSIVIAIGLVICSLGLLFWPKKLTNNPVENEEASKESKNERNISKGIIIGASIIIYAILLPVVGFIISTILFLLFAVNYLAEVRTKKSVILSVIISAGVAFSIFYVFEAQLRIFLP